MRLEFLCSLWRNDNACAGDSEYEEHILLSRKAVAVHDLHAAHRRMGADQQFFHHAAFSLQPLQGCVWPEVSTVESGHKDVDCVWRHFRWDAMHLHCLGFRSKPDSICTPAMTPFLLRSLVHCCA